MRKVYAVLLALILPVVLLSVTLADYILPYYEDATSGDLMPLSSGYLPLSLSPTNVQALYQNDSGTMQFISPDGSGSYLNTVTKHTKAGFYRYSGFRYYISSRIPLYSTVDITVTAPDGTSFARFVTETSSSFSVSSQLSSDPFLSSVDSLSSSNVSVRNSSGKTVQDLGTYTYGSTMTFRFVVSDTLESFYIYFLNGHSALSSPFTSYTSYNISEITISVTITPPDYEEWLPLIYGQSVDTGQYVQHISVNSDMIVQYLQDLSIASGSPSEMEKFESGYLDKMDNQLAQIEDMMSSANPALPNGGDVAGFASDVQGGLGVNGSSFDAAAFSEATSAFSGASATEAGGPWEFFTQSVADFLSGDTMSVGLADDDYIYAWFDEMQRRYGAWVSSSP